mgnify:CR=1 FL=1
MQETVAQDCYLAYGRKLRNLRYTEEDKYVSKKEETVAVQRVNPLSEYIRETRGELGLHGHWVKLMLHHLFLYKAKARLGWPNACHESARSS